MKSELIACFHDTLQISEGKFSENTMTSVKSNKVYKENFVSKNHNKDENAVVSVHSGTSFDVAKKYREYGKVAVLNFANPQNPGGGVSNGAMAQEECLCRSSNLYACISNENVFDEYYGYHREIHNCFFSDRLIYTKDVTVFKNDDEVPSLMPENEWFNVDVITCAAPFLGKRKYTNKKALKELFKGRIKNIFEASIDNEVDVLILGAFGCGAFKNPPEVVAEAFYEVIIENEYQKCFKQIVFAIKSTNDDNPFEPCPNIFAFETTFMWDSLDSGLDVHITTSEFGKLRWTDNYPLAQAVGYVELPSGRILKGGKEFNPYFEWRDKNKYCGKQFSILGDSISTLNGYNPRGYKVFYYGDNCRKAHVEESTDTWWGEVLKFFGADLLVNNSWSGSRVTKLPNQEELFPSGCSDERTSSLHINSVNPDVIIINLGTNDWAFGARTGEETRILDDVESELFEEAYRIMLQKIKSNYPESEVWCCTLSETFISNKPEFSFPHKYVGIHIEEYNEIIRRTVRENRCKLIDLYNMKMPYDSIDGSHPNKSGMKTIAASVCYAMANDTGKSFLAFDENDEPGIYEVYLSYGNFRIHNVTISRNRMIYKNTIHGSRDGGLNYAENFFEEKEIRLNRMQKNRLDAILRNLELEEASLDDKTILYPGEKAKDRFQLFTFDETYFDIKNPRTLIDFCEELCDFIPYEANPVPVPICLHDFVVEEEYTGGTKYVCKKCGFVKHKTFFDLISEREENKEVSCQDDEYVFVDSNITTILYDNTILLTDESTGKEIKIKESQFDFGRNNDCVFRLDKSTISANHATFLYEKNNWFIRDNNSTNGTRINGVRITPKKKYQLLADDVIEFANTFKYTFYKTKAKNENVLNLKEQVKAIEEECLIGKLIGDKYRLKEIIGTGGLTKVYLAIDSTNKKFAVKSIMKNAVAHKAVMDVILSEVELLKRLEHPNIRKAVEQIEDETHIFIVLEYVDAINLESLTSKTGGILPVEKVIGYAVQIAEALQYIHSLNPPIINRDIKPRNILIDVDDNVKLVDFDIAMEYNPSQEDICVLGTKGYAPPEQYAGITTPKSDIFALGMVMHQLLTGVNPVEPPYETNPIRQYNSSYTKELERIIEKCTRPNPDERYSNCRELIEALNRERSKANKKGLLEKLGLKK